MVTFCLLTERLEEIILFNIVVKKAQNKQSMFGKFWTTAGSQLTFPSCLFSGKHRVSMGGVEEPAGKSGQTEWQHRC